MKRRAIIEKSNKEIAQRWSSFRAMWTLVLFDLPVKTRQDRKNYARFRKEVLKLGFVKMQFSVYYKHAASDEKATALANKLKKILPPHGEVRIMQITAHQFQKMIVFHGKIPHDPETEPQQLELF